MKATSSLFLVSAALLVGLSTGCSRSEGSSPTVSSAAPATAAVRTIAITANDTMKFNVTEIHVRPGETVAVTLTNEGNIPKVAMGHNWVLFTPGTDLNAVAASAPAAAATNYIPADVRDKVIASTKLLGPKESDTTRFTAPTTPGRYPFACTFPGHMQVGMKGDLVVE